MKFKKRITAVAVAIIMAVSGAMSMTVSADIGSHQTSSYIVVSYYTVTTPTASTKYIQSVGTVTNLSSTTASYSVQATLYA